jgi:catechol 2,3-dioxygenase-like lactoylglutathione lyase family enzyme
MEKPDTILAVRDVDASAAWYEKIFGFENASPPEHGFAVLRSPQGGVMLCLHRWGMDDHPTMKDPGLTPGNGLMLYFRLPSIDEVYQRAVKAGCRIEEDIHQNPRPGKREFSLRDPDGYFLTVSEFHDFGS